MKHAALRKKTSEVQGSSILFCSIPYVWERRRLTMKLSLAFSGKNVKKSCFYFLLKNKKPYSLPQLQSVILSFVLVSRMFSIQMVFIQIQEEAWMALILITRNLVTFSEVFWDRYLWFLGQDLTSPEPVIGLGGAGEEISRAWNKVYTSAPLHLGQEILSDGPSLKSQDYCTLKF